MTEQDLNDNFIPIIFYVDYINIEYQKYLKSTFENIIPRDFTYLLNIFYHPNISQRALSDLLKVSEANVGKIIKRLEKNNLIYRKLDEKNKSKRNINLTEKGQESVLSLLKLSEEWEKQFFKKYDKKEEKLFKKNDLRLLPEQYNQLIY